MNAGHPHVVGIFYCREKSYGTIDCSRGYKRHIPDSRHELLFVSGNVIDLSMSSNGYFSGHYIRNLQTTSGNITLKILKLIVNIVYMRLSWIITGTT